jgi:exodeoxyribonuclease VII small subunit
VAERVRAHARAAVLTRARALSSLARAPAAHLERERGRLHQQLREMRAGSRRRVQAEWRLCERRALVLSRKADSTALDCRTRRARELESLGLALAGHDPQRTLERGYALVTTGGGEVLATAASARARERAPALRRRRARGEDRGAMSDADAAHEQRAAPPDSAAAPTYETASARVEEIIKRLDSGEASLSETLELIKEGKALIELCASELSAVGDALTELRLDELVERLSAEANSG